MNLSKSTVKLLLSNVVVSVVTFVGLAFFARELNPEQMGVFFLFETSVRILALVSDLGIRGAVEKYMSENRNTKEIIGTALAIKLPVLVVLSVGIFFVRAPINAYIGGDVALLLIVGMILQDIARFSIQTLRGELRVEATALPQASRAIVWVVFGSILLTIGFDVLAVIYAYLFSYLILAGSGIYLINTGIGIPSRSTARTLLSYGKHEFVSNSGQYIYNWMDVALIGFFLAQSYVGAYEYAWRVSVLVMIASRAIGYSTFPQMSSWSADQAIEKIETMIPKATAMGLFITIPSFMGVLVFSHDILRILFGEGYTLASTVLIILMAEKILRSVDIIFARTAKSLDHPEIVGKASLYTIIINLLLNVLLIPTIGIIGAAIATALSSAIRLFYNGISLASLVQVNLTNGLIRWYFLASLLMAAISLIYKRIVVVDGLPSLLTGIVACGGIYVALVFVNAGFREKLVQPIWNELT